MNPPALVILNPHSGGGAGRRLRSEIERELEARGIAFTIRETGFSGQAVDLAREAALAGTTTILAAGGDGTVHEVANGLLQARTERPEARAVLGIVPIGTGNDLIKAVTGGTDRRPAYDVIAGGHVRSFDAGLVEWDGGREFFVNAAGTGIDVEVVRQIERLPRMPGIAGYFIGLLRALVRFRPIPIQVRLDGEVFDETVMIIAVGNGHSLGGGFLFTPDALPDDGWFDVCMVKKLNLFQVIRVLAGVLRGAHGGSPHVLMRKAKSVEIVAGGEAPLFFQLDGELREPPAARAMRVRLERAVLPVLALEETKTHGGGTFHDDALGAGYVKLTGGAV